MAKIGLDFRWFGAAHSGVGLVNSHLLDELARAESPHDFVIFTGPAHWDEIPKLPKNFKKVRTTDSFFSVAEQTIFLRDLLREKCDLVHFTNFNAPVFYPRKFVATVHDLTTIFYPGKKMPHFWHRWPFFLSLGNAILRAKKVLTVSEFTKNDIVRRFKISPKKIAVAWNGPAGDPGPAPDPAAVAAVRQKYGLGDAPVILYIGVFRDHKNIPGLFRGFAKIADKIPHHLVLAGRAEDVYLAPLLAEIRAAGLEDRVHLTGLFPDADRAPLLAAAEIYAQPSFYEGFGMPLLEAFAAGVPVASSDAASLPEVAGDAAEFFDPADPDSIARALENLAKNPARRAELVAAGRARVRDFSWEKMGREVLAVYDAALRG